MRLSPAEPIATADARTDRLNAEGFAEAFTAHSRALWCIAASVLIDRHQAEDVLQEGAIIALQKLDQFQPGTNFLAWMGRIVRFVALNHGRRRQRAMTSPVDPETIEAMAAAPTLLDPAPTTARGEVAPGQVAFDDNVIDALGVLGETARSCLLLRTLLDMPYREIALALDIPEGTAMSHVHRARSAMRARLVTPGASARSQP